MTRRNSPWTAEEQQFLIENYQGMTDAELSQYMPHTAASINVQRFKLKLTKNIPWTDTDLQYLRDNYQLMSAEDMGIVLGRTKNVVSSQCSRLDLKKRTRIKPDSAYAKRKPPAVSHPIEPTPDVIPGLIIKGEQPASHHAELVAMVEAMKAKNGTYNDGRAK